ncbi:MAG: hypothetical protein KF718_20925 [Polyangiaceae bacterium]|nr:hypothetical protein [Polyangiaceae bacterium]
MTRAARVLLVGALLALPFGACSSPIESTEGDASTGGGGSGGAPAGGTGGADASSGGVGGGATGGWGGYAFGHCDVPTPSSCSLEQTCKQLGCGQGWARLDTSGCLRANCKADEDCAPGERCISPHLVALGCFGSRLEGGCFVHEPTGDCLCTLTADCRGPLLCVPLTVAPPESDCSYPAEHMTCLALMDATEALLGASSITTGAAKDAMQACYDKLKPELAKLGCE